jgi:hypothetical protein
MRWWEAVLLLIVIGFVYLFSTTGFSLGSIGSSLSTTFASVGTTNRADLIMHPERYYNQNVTIVDSPTSTWSSPYFAYVPMNYSIYEKDEEGKAITLAVAYSHFYCSKCKITGVVEKLTICYCQFYYCWDRCYKDIKNWTNNGIALNTITLDERYWNESNYATILDSNQLVEHCDVAPRETTTELGTPLFAFSRCKPNSTYSVYYLNVTHVTSLD